MTLHIRLFLLVTISIAMAATPIIFSTYGDFLSSNIEMEKNSFRNISSLLKETLEYRYTDLLTYQANFTQQRKIQIQKITNVLASNLAIINQLPSNNQKAFLKNWIKKIQSFDIHTEIFNDDGSTFIQDELFLTLTKRPDIKDFKGRSLQTILNTKKLPQEGEFTVFDHKILSGSDPILVYILPSKETNTIIVAALHVHDIAKNTIDTEQQLINFVQEKIQTFKLHKNSFISVFDTNGKLLVHKGIDAGKTSHIIPNKILSDSHHTDIAEGQVIINKEENFVLVSYFKSLGWYIVAAAPESEIKAPTRALIHELIGITLAAILNSLLVTLILTSKLIQPLQTVTQKALTFSELNFASPEAEELAVRDLPVNRSDEVGQLARAFSMMVKTITQNIRDTMETTASKERMLGELNAAKDIQIGILPQQNQKPLHPKYDTAVFLEPAKEVGGDLYDFLIAPNGKQVIVIGDVSGKGIPAALFMSMTVTLIRYAITKNLSPANIAKEINAILSKNNPQSMFVTLFIGIFDPDSGELEYINAGHCQPYIVNKDNKKPAFLVESKYQNPIVGALPEAEYQNAKITLNIHDVCFLYTDGVTEAMNESLELYGHDRLKKTLERNRKKSLAGILDSINQSVIQFRKNLKQSDDITMLCFSRNT